MTVFGITIPGWYPYFAGVVFAGLVLYLVVDVLAARHRAPDEEERTDEDDYEPRHPAGDETTVLTAIVHEGAADDETTQLWLKEMRTPGHLTEMEEFSDEWWEGAIGEFRTCMDSALRIFDDAFYRVIGTEFGAEWAAAVHDAAANKAEWRARVALGEDTSAHPMLELIGAR